MHIANVGNGCHTKTGMESSMQESYEDKEWIVYKRTNKGTQLTYINTIIEYQPTKLSVTVCIHTAARRTVYRELGAEIKIDNELSVGPVKWFEQLIVDQLQWIRDLIEFVSFESDKWMYNQMATTIKVCSRLTT